MQASSEVATFDFSDPSLWVPAYLPLFNDTRRRKMLYGGRDSAKSFYVAERIILRMLEERCKGVMVRKAYNSIQESQWQTIKEIVEDWGLQDCFVFHKSPLEIICLMTGARLLAKGMDKPGKSKSLKDIDFIWYEEFDELTLEDFTTTTLTLRGKNIEEWITFNSTDEDHWILQRFFPGNSDGGHWVPDFTFESADGMFTEVTSTDPSTTIIHTCYLHNPFCNEDRRVQYEWLRDNLPEFYRTEGLGMFGRKNIGSLWCKQFDRREHVSSVPLQYDPGYPVHLTMDQNRLPYSTMLVIQVVPVGELTEIRVKPEYCLAPPKNSTEEVCDAFISDFGHLEPEVRFYGDPTGGSESMKKEKAEMKSHYHSFEKYMKPFLNQSSNQVLKFAPSIKGRQRFMAALLKNGTYLRLVIDPSCRNLIGDFEHLVEDENGGYVKRRVKDKKTGQTWEERGHCFTGETMITTNNGPKRMDQMTWGDMVLTRKGFRRVLKVHDNGVQGVVEVSIAGRKMRCTPDHKFFTVNRGFVALQYLQAGDQLLGTQWNTPHSTAASSPGIRRASVEVMRSISRAVFQSMASGRCTSTATCGRSYAGRSPKASTCITETTMPATTTSATSNCSNKVNIAATIRNWYGWILDIVRRYSVLLQRAAPRQRSGIGHQRALRGTGSMEEQRMPSVRVGWSSALHAAQTFTPPRHPASSRAATCAGGSCGTRAMEARRASACTADPRFQFIELSQSDIAQVHAALELVRSAKVYDLMVQGEHEYFANGILVHNCMDALINFLFQCFNGVYRLEARV